MTTTIATEIDRQAELSLVAASRGQLELESALLDCSAALTAWTSLGGEYWPESQYWEQTIRLIRRTGKVS